LTKMNHNITDLGIPPESELRGIGITRSGQRIGLHICEELHRFHYAFLNAVTAVFYTAKGQ
jgi:hypothetical protein